MEIKDGFRVYPDGREVCSQNHKLSRLEYQTRTIAMAKRQKWRCALCGLPMSSSRFRAFDYPTFDHEHGRGMGGAKRDDRIEINGIWQNGAVHLLCNQNKGSRKVPYVITQETFNE